MSDLRPRKTVERLPDGRLRSRVCARASLLGNPSDGYGGAVLSLSLAQFAAEVILTPGDSLRFQPNPIGDRLDFEDIETFVSYVGGHGYRGGIPVLQAVVRQVCQNFCIGTKSASPLPPLFSLSYSTSIPRQRGLSGSSAIACAALNCVLEYWGLSAVCPPTHRPALLLAAEQDLGIQAGLQDRIVQVFGGIVFADYSDLTADQSQAQTCPKGARVTRVYRNKTQHPPLLFIVHPEHTPPGKDSGQVHSNFKRRWDSGNMPELKTYMEEMAQLARSGVKAFEDEDWEKLGSLMDKTFALRRLMFGDDGLGLENIKMVEQLKLKIDNIHATLCGSGGALAVLCSKHGAEQASRLKSVCLELELSCHQAQVGPSFHEEWYAKGDFDPNHRASEFLFVPFCL